LDVAAGETRTAWSDARLDDFRREVSSRFDGVDARFDRIDGRFDRVDERLDRMDQRFDRMDVRFDNLYRTMLTVGGGMIASILVGAAGIAATQL
jgi:hypothetical protein